jgi:catechol 2,3-dioxygenase-like lactoylglutathione lyase family enzyme
VAKKTVYIPDELLDAVGLGGEANLSREFQQFLRRRLAHGYDEPPPPTPVRDLVPYAHVRDVGESVDFYSLLGFEPVSTVGGRGQDRWWVYLQAGRARLMLALATEPVVAEAQAVLFYLYADDLGRLRSALVAGGLDPSPIGHPAHMPAGEMRLHDPDGYVLLVGQLRPKP